MNALFEYEGVVIFYHAILVTTKHFTQADFIVAPEFLIYRPRSE
jgi:hypothetical protein